MENEDNKYEAMFGEKIRAVYEAIDAVDSIEEAYDVATDALEIFANIIVELYDENEKLKNELNCLKKAESE